MTDVDPSPGQIARLAMYQQRLEESKKRYEDQLKAFIKTRTDATKKDEKDLRGQDEDWDVYDAALQETEQTGREAYFSRTGIKWPSFYKSGGYTDEDVRNHLDRARTETGKKILAVDLLGQGRPCVELGAEKVLATTLFPDDRIHPNVELITGDALSAEKSNQLLNRIKELKEKENCSFQLMFFRPVCGLDSVKNNLYVLRTLYDRLRQLYELMDEGGLLFISSSSFATGAHDVRFMRQILKKMNCDLVLQSPTPSNQLVIKKSVAVPRFPTEAEIGPEFINLLDELIMLDNQDRAMSWSNR